MKDRNTYRNFEFILEHGIWLLLSWIFYKAYLFRCIGSLSFINSQLLLLGIAVTVCTVGILVNIKHNRNTANIVFDLILSYGIYTVIAYMQIWRVLILVSLSVAAVLAVVYAIMLMTRKIKNKKRRGVIIRRRVWNILNVSVRLLGVGMTVIMLVFFVNFIFSSSIIRSTAGAKVKIKDNERMLSDNMETLSMLQEDIWNGLTVQKKLNVLQTVADIEQMLLGIPNEFNVGTANLDKKVKGYYRDNTHEIIVDMNALLEDDSWYTVEIVCHEVYHGYQRRMVDVLMEVDESERNLSFFRKANVYAQEFNNYIDGRYDIDAYFDQMCEDDAYLYGYAASCDYYDKVEEYMAEKEAGN